MPLTRRDAPRRVGGEAGQAAVLHIDLAPRYGTLLETPRRATGGGYDGPLAYRMGKPTPQ
jgi:hypothetical protein